jgi:drug/metabolite transporter (DMT)-like permease
VDDACAAYDRGRVMARVRARLAEKSDDTRGVICLLLAALAFSSMSVVVKLAGRELPLAMLVLARGAVSLALSFSIVRASGISVWGHHPPRLLLRAAFGLGALVSYFFALTVLPLAETTVLHYLNPVFTALIAAVWLKERVDRRLIVAIALAFTGTLAVAQPAALFGAAATLPAAGVAAALLSAALSACAYVTVRSLSGRESPEVIVFYFALVSTPAPLPFAIAGWVWPSPRGWLLLLAIGVAAQLGQMALTRGLSLVPAGRATAIGYVQIVLAALWGFIVFGEQPTAWTLAGAVLVFAGTWLLLSRRVHTSTGVAELR